MQLGGLAGPLNQAGVNLTGLCPGTAVAVANVDAHVTVPAVKVTGSKKMVAIMGTSTCHMLIGDHLQAVEGMCGVVHDGIVPGVYGYEAGQSWAVIFPTVASAAQCMGSLKEEIILPIPANQKVYDRLYDEYRTLYDYFSRGANDAMKRLKTMRKNSRQIHAIDLC